MSEQLQTFLQGALPKGDLDACAALIAEGDAVDPDTAAEHLPDCVFVVVKRDGDQIVGVGAIKDVRPEYAARRALLSRHDFDPNMHELDMSPSGSRTGIRESPRKSQMDSSH